MPSASRIPCIQAFPAGVVGALAVRDGESVLQLSQASVDININAGGEPQAAAQAGSVTIRLTASCAAQRIGDGQTVAPGVRRVRSQGPAGTPQVVDVFPRRLSHLPARARHWLVSPAPGPGPARCCLPDP